MIARIWKGWTTHANAEHYQQLFHAVVVPKVTAGVSGYRSVNLLKQVHDDCVEFTTIFWFDSLEAVKAFAGSSYHQSVIPEEVEALLLRYQATAEHHQVVL